MRRSVGAMFLAVAMPAALACAQAAKTIVGGAEFLQACESGDAHKVEQMLAANAELMNVRQANDGATPLHLAKNAAVAAVLINNGADIEALDSQSKSTPLHWALDRELWNGKSDTAAYLLEQGASTDGLLCECALGKIAAVKQLVEKDHALVNSVAKPEEQLGMTPLEVAATYNHADLVNYLIDHGADVNLKERPTVLHEVAFLGRIDIARILIARGINLDTIEPRYHETALGWAVYAGRLEMVKFLLARGARVRPMDIGNAVSGKGGQNQAGQGATPKDYAAIEILLRAHFERPTTR